MKNVVDDVLFTLIVDGEELFTVKAGTVSDLFGTLLGQADYDLIDLQIPMPNVVEAVFVKGERTIITRMTDISGEKVN